MKVLPITLLLSLGIFLVPAGGAGAQGADTSPFVAPKAAGAAGLPADGSTYELRGIMATGDNRQYCIFDPAKKASQWVRLNEPGHPFLVKTADPAHDSVTIVTEDGRSLTLTLREAKVASLNPGAGPVQAIGMPPGGMAAANMVINPTPEDNQRRLQAIAEEVRRRRLLREQAAQQSQQPGPPRQQ
jgi:hypothetical protein